MVEKGLFPQNVIAIVWDFDKTLTPQYMQAPLFAYFGVDGPRFWREVNALPAYYARAGIRVQPDTCYLGHLLTYVAAGRMPGLSNAKLRELGREIRFFPGIVELFARLRKVLEEPTLRDGDLRLEHYVVSTGLAEMIRGSAISESLDGVWASEFIETVAQPGEDLGKAPAPGAISQIAGFLDNTTKTRAIFEINKGVNKHPEIGVNAMVREEDRRVPFRNLIYVADGPTDIPSFSVVRKHGGLAYAVFEPGNEEQFSQVVALQQAGRVDDHGPADYAPGSTTDMWLRLKVRQIAQRIMAERRQLLGERISRGPAHLADD